MSQLLVVLFNSTSVPLQFVNMEDSSNNQLVQPGQMFRTDTHFNIPDMSNCQQYFAQHHMEIQSSGSGPTTTFFSFWDDDKSNYQLQYCVGTKCSPAPPQTTPSPMPGYSNGGNNATVGIVVTGTAPNYAINAYQVINNV